MNHIQETVEHEIVERVARLDELITEFNEDEDRCLAELMEDPDDNSWTLQEALAHTVSALVLAGRGEDAEWLRAQALVYEAGGAELVRRDFNTADNCTCKRCRTRRAWASAGAGVLSVSGRTH